MATVSQYLPLGDVQQEKCGKAAVARGYCVELRPDRDPKGAWRNLILEMLSKGLILQRSPESQ